jgi:gliding motility-associated-like protein
MLAILCNVGNAQTRPTYPQNENCPGLKNPSNFTFGGGWTGYTGGSGTKQSNLSTCTTPGYSALTQVPSASQLESQATSSSCSGNSSSSQNIDGQADCSKRFVIKGGNNTSQLGDPANGGQLTYLPPDTSYHTSIRLGNYCTGAEVEQLTYQMTINPNNAMVVIWYAMSLQYAGHPTGQNPEFSIIVEKQQKNAQGNPVYDANGNPVWELAGQSMCYIKEAPTSSQLNNLPAGMHNYNSQNIWKEWNKVMVNLYDLMYQNVQIKITAGDCSQHGHYAACYFAGECQPMKLSANGCAAGESNAVALIKAPKGAVSYAWYRSKTGKLTGDDRSNDNSYVLIQGETDDSLGCIVEHFIRTDNLDTVTQSTFMCKMTTVMNESYPIVSSIFTDVGNTKPAIHIDSALNCQAGITLMDNSFTPYAPDDTNKVDHDATVWRFYSSNPPTDQTLVGTYTGDTVSHFYTNGGNNYSVKVRVRAIDSTCWNEKTIPIRTIKPPVPQITLQRDSLCEGDTIVVYNSTLGAAYTEWTILGREGDTTHTITPTTVGSFRFDTTSLVQLHTRNNIHYQADTNTDGILDNVYCYVDTNITVHVDEYPVLEVTGDTIVCNGTQAIINVNSQNPQTRYDWFTSMSSNNPLQSNTATLTTMPTHDERYYVKARSPFNCISWDSINIYVVDPQLSVPITKMCENDQVKLYASNAYSYTWTSMPDDPSMAGQTSNDTLTVSPQTTTTYTLVGHGMNNCSADPLTATITVFHHPVPTFEMSPYFIDSEEPVVTFRDVSPGSTYTFWDFGSGNTSNEVQVRHTFTDLSEDSVLIKMTTGTGGELQCNRDTSFYVPIELFAVWFPNAFTPEESTNNTFSLFTHNNLEFFSIHIYDRHGNQILYSNDQNFVWDGTYNGHQCPLGVYIYTCTYRRPGTTDIVTQRGTVTLLR